MALFSLAIITIVRAIRSRHFTCRPHTLSILIIIIIESSVRLRRVGEGHTVTFRYQDFEESGLLGVN